MSEWKYNIHLNALKELYKDGVLSEYRYYDLRKKLKLKFKEDSK